MKQEYINNLGCTIKTGDLIVFWSNTQNIGFVFEFKFLTLESAPCAKVWFANSPIQLIHIDHLTSTKEYFRNQKNV